MKLIYFAWVRDHTGCAEEEVLLSPEINTVGALVQHLAQRSDGYARAFENLSVVRVAVNQEFATLDTALDGAEEVAFFPPVTGG